MKKLLLSFLFSCSLAFAQSSGGVGVTPISRGGTGATTITAARENLGIYGLTDGNVQLATSGKGVLLNGGSSMVSTSGNLTFTSGGSLIPFKNAGGTTVALLNMAEPTAGLTGPGRLFIGTNAPSGDNSAVLVGRNLVGAQAQGSHSFRDESTITWSGATGLYGHASFDSIFTVNFAATPAGVPNHAASFQSRINYAAAGTLPNLQGYTFQTTVSGSGTINQNIGMLMSPLIRTGTGKVVSNIGIYFDDLTHTNGDGTQTSAFSIYSSGPQASYHAGLFQAGQLQSEGTAVVGNTGFTTSSWGANGIQLRVPAKNFTNSSTAASGTAPLAVFNSFGRPGLAASNANVTTTIAATVYIEDAPQAIANQTITNPYALYIASGTSKINGNIDVGNLIGGNKVLATDGAGVMIGSTKLSFVGAANGVKGAGYIAASGTLTDWSAGGGAYTYYDGASAFFSAYSDTSGTYAPAKIDGSSVEVKTSGTTRVTVTSAKVTSTLPIVFPSYTVASLPNAATMGAGATAYATDLTSTASGSTATGGGSGKHLVSSDGSNWIVQ